MLGQIFGAGGDALDMTLVTLLVGATITIMGWLHRRRDEENKRFAAINLRLTLLERQLQGASLSGVHTTEES